MIPVIKSSRGRFFVLVQGVRMATTHDIKTATWLAIELYEGLKAGRLSVPGQDSW